MQQKLAILVGVVLVLFLNVFSSQASKLNVAIVADFSRLDESENNVNELSEILSTVFDSLAGEKNITVQSFDSLKAGLGTDLSSDIFNAVDPIQLLQANTPLRIDALLFASIGKINKKNILTIRAAEFPSGTTIEHISVPLKSVEPGKFKESLVAPFNAVFTSLHQDETTLGFPLHPDEKGIVIVAGNFDNENLKNAIDRFSSQLLPGESESDMIPPRIKLLSYAHVDDPGDDEFKLGQAINEKLHSRFVVFWPDSADSNEHKSAEIVFSKSQVPTPFVERYAPLNPGYKNLTTFQCGLDSSEIELLSEAIFPIGENEYPRFEQFIADSLDRFQVPLLMNVAMNSHHVWVSDSTNPDRDSTRYTVAKMIYENLHERKMKSAATKGWIDWNLGAFYRQNAQFDSAAIRLASCDSLFTLSHDSLGLALSALEKARLANAQKKWSDAKTAYQSVLDFVTAQHDTFSSANIYSHLAMIAELEGDSDSAENYYQKSAELNSALHNTYGSFRIYGHLGELMRNVNQPAKSLEYLKTSLQKADEMHNEPVLARALFQLGVTSVVLGLNDEAIQHFHDAAGYMKILGDSAGLARVDNKLGTIYLNRKDYEKAQSSYEAALYLATRRADSSNMLQSLFNLGEMASEQKRWNFSQENFDQALKIARGLGNPRLVANVLYSKGLAHLKEGLLRSGYDEVKEAIDMTNGSVYGTPEESRAFLAKIEALIGDMHELNSRMKYGTFRSN
ncbi:MAG: tetratricopeptide repeat protein [Calditrichaeota bacterium]|nr:tetratricopeptide repeat protein [Calditrichota bacterium]